MKTFLPFSDAREYVRRFRFKSFLEWKCYRKSQNIDNIPSRPDQVYDEWLNYSDWLGRDSKTDWRRKYSVDDDYFKKHSPEMFYILGFWFADGCAYKNQFIITQHTKDKYILEKFLLCMNSSYIVNVKKSISEIRISSSEIVKDVILMGGKERKSLDVSFPDIPLKYLRDFIRGYFDGDGSISYHSKRGCYRSSFASASEKFVTTLLEIIKVQIPEFNGRIEKRLGKNKRTYYYMVMGKGDTLRLGKFLYTESNLYLRRKKDRFILSGALK